jgi:hypothetical protein
MIGMTGSLRLKAFWDGRGDHKIIGITDELVRSFCDEINKVVSFRKGTCCSEFQESKGKMSSS